MAKCLWSGIKFAPTKRGGNEKIFANDRGRAAAHRAARKYTEQLIADGYLSWSALREWWDAQHVALQPSYTAPPGQHHASTDATTTP